MNARGLSYTAITLSGTDYWASLIPHWGAQMQQRDGLPSHVRTPPYSVPLLATPKRTFWIHSELSLSSHQEG